MRYRLLAWALRAAVPFHPAEEERRALLELVREVRALDGPAAAAPAQPATSR